MKKLINNWCKRDVAFIPETSPNPSGEKIEGHKKRKNKNAPTAFIWLSGNFLPTMVRKFAKKCRICLNSHSLVCRRDRGEE